MQMTSNVCLIVIDGWGVPTRKKGDAIHAAATPVMDALTATGYMRVLGQVELTLQDEYCRAWLGRRSSGR